MNELKHGILQLSETLIHQLLKFDETFEGNVQIIDAKWDGFYHVIELVLAGTDKKMYIIPEGGAIPALEIMIKEKV